MRKPIIFFLLVIPSALVSAEKLDISRYATPGKDYLTEQQLHIMLLHRESSLIRILDTNRDGTLSDEEIGQFPDEVKSEIIGDVAKSKNNAISTLHDIQLKIGKKDKYSIVKLQKMLKISRNSINTDIEKNNKAQWDWGLAEERSHLPILGNDVSVSKRKPATFNYVKNGEDRSEQLSASGAFYINAPLTDLDTANRADRIGASATFNRVQGSNDSNDVNSLDLRLTYILKHAVAEEMLLGHEFSYLHSTDFDFESNINGFEYLLSPFMDDWCLLGKYCGKNNRLFNYRIIPSVGAVWAKVSEPAPSTKTQEGEEYLRLGGGVELQIYPKLNDSSFLSISFDSYSGVIEEKENVELWEINFSYPLTETNNVSFVIGYQEGQLLISEQDIELFKIGIGIRH